MDGYLATVICHLLCCGEDLIQLEDRNTRWDIHAIRGHDLRALHVVHVKICTLSCSGATASIAAQTAWSIYSLKQP